MIYKQIQEFTPDEV